MVNSERGYAMLNEILANPRAVRGWSLLTSPFGNLEGGPSVRTVKEQRLGIW